MINTFAIIVIAAASLAAQTRPAAPVKAAGKAASKASAPVALTIPSGAAANPDGTYSYTDKDGKQWKYVKTPFGVMRSEATAAVVPVAEKSESAVKAIDAGDKVRFVRQTPFGPITMEKSKADLNDEEKALVAKQAAKQE